MSRTKSLRLTCPDCGSDLVVDARTGAVLSHRRPKEPPAGGKDFDALLAGLDESRNRAEKLFEQEKAAMADRERLLEEKFRAALQRAEEEPDDGPPPRPFDLD
ncbi:MAG: hypothetical protein GX178_06280 [Acidobacteria bacterium]|nr:hypothetical protein [Thermoanaerobaculia bacterium]MDI9632209.1 hypothetical protein [Acidobacteriota bacterium]MBP7813514.1 hypothetical protein [Thermoanaerobaculia bacterium]MBP8846012.1 hypothetical protein [Thermoanaerobaculia bacterium]NLN11196.1 hypothetical protein [Acidobacteriota bacterium]